MSKEIQQIIQFLQKNNFKAECANCGDSFSLKDSPLFSPDEFTPEAKELLKEKKEFLKERKLEISQRTATTTQRLETTTQSVNIGFILERLAPVLKEFRFDKNDCRSLFDPIDYVIFDGLNKTGEVQKIFFIDIKTGEARLKKNQKAVKQKVQDKLIEFKHY
jgi:predicted Holliday junction resolvase-like endonuclease